MRYFIVLLLLILTGCSDKPTEQNTSKQTVHIAALLPLTGSFASYGKYMQEGIELALDDAKAKGLLENTPVEVLFEDVQTDPKKSVTSLIKLSSLHNVEAVLPVTSAATLAVKKIANDKKIILINTTAVSTDISDQNDFVYSVLPNAKMVSDFLAKNAIEKLGSKYAAIIYRDDASGENFKQMFTEAYTKLGGKIVFTDANKPSSFEFRTSIEKLKGTNADSVFVASFGTEVAAYLKQAKTQNYKANTLAYETFYSPKALEESQGSANGILFPVPVFDIYSNEPDVDQLRNKVKKRYGNDEINYYMGTMYDATMMIINAVASGAQDSTQIKSYLDKHRQYAGVTGQIMFDENGAVTVPMKLFTVKENSFAPAGDNDNGK